MSKFSIEAPNLPCLLSSIWLKLLSKESFQEDNYTDVSTRITDDLDKLSEFFKSYSGDEDQYSNRQTLLRIACNRRNLQFLRNPSMLMQEYFIQIQKDFDSRLIPDEDNIAILYCIFHLLSKFSIQLEPSLDSAIEEIISALAQALLSVLKYSDKLKTFLVFHIIIAYEQVSNEVSRISWESCSQSTEKLQQLLVEIMNTLKELRKRNPPLNALISKVLQLKVYISSCWQLTYSNHLPLAVERIQQISGVFVNELRPMEGKLIELQDILEEDLLVLNFVGKVSKITGQSDGSIIQYSVSLTPSFMLLQSQILLAQSFLLFKQNRLDEVQQLLEKSEWTTEAKVSVLNNLGLVMLSKQKPALARLRFHAAIQCFDNNLDFRRLACISYNAGLASLMQRYPAEALVFFAKAATAYNSLRKNPLFLLRFAESFRELENETLLSKALECRNQRRPVINCILSQSLDNATGSSDTSIKWGTSDKQPEHDILAFDDVFALLKSPQSAEEVKLSLSLSGANVIEASRAILSRALLLLLLQETERNHHHRKLLSSVLLSLSYASLRLDDPITVIALFEQNKDTIKASRQSTLFLSYYAEALCRLRRSEDASAVLNKLLTSDPSIDSTTTRCSSLRVVNYFMDGAVILGKMDGPVDSHVISSNLAVAQLLSTDNVNIANLKQIIQDSPTLPSPWKMLIYSALQQKNFGEAQSLVSAYHQAAKQL